jgi:hypothetical protein
MVSKDDPLRAPRGTYGEFIGKGADEFIGKGADPVHILHNEIIKSAKQRERIGHPTRKRKTRRSKK